MSSCCNDVDLNCGHIHTFGEICLVVAKMWSRIVETYTLLAANDGTPQRDLWV